MYCNLKTANILLSRYEEEGPGIIAKDLGETWQRVRGWAQEIGLRKTGSPGKGRLQEEGVRNSILLRYPTEGATALAKELGLSYDTLRSYARELGVKVNPSLLAFRAGVTKRGKRKSEGKFLCCGCKELLQVEDFHRSPTNTLGIKARCKLCCWEETLKYKYGIELEDYEAMVISQGGGCAICRDPLTTPHIDHCHKTGKVRGVLCDSCNRGIGALRDSPFICRQAALYLAKVYGEW